MQYFDPEQHHRRSIRIKDFDYSQNGAYLITLCSERRKHLFSIIENGKSKLTDIGGILDACWKEIPDHFQDVTTDYYVIMPNHVHGILFLDKPLTKVMTGGSLEGKSERFSQPQKGTVPTIVRSYKSACTRIIRSILGKPQIRVWQPSYWERVIRDEEELLQFRTYIVNNPAQWELDRFYGRELVE